MYRLFEKRAGELVFSLLGGLSYFFIIWHFIARFTYRAGGLLAFFFAPAIICGGAYILIQTIRNWREREWFGKLNALIIIHALIFLIAIAFLLELLIR